MMQINLTISDDQLFALKAFSGIVGMTPEMLLGDFAESLVTDLYSQSHRAAKAWYMVLLKRKMEYLKQSRQEGNISQ